MQENSILLYGLSNIKYAIFQQLFDFDYIGSDYRIIRCDNSFEKLLKQPCACIVLAPSKLTSEQTAALNERYPYVGFLSSFFEMSIKDLK